MWTIRPDTELLAAKAVETLRAMIDEDAPAARFVHAPVPVDETGKPLG